MEVIEEEEKPKETKKIEEQKEATAKPPATTTEPATTAKPSTPPAAPKKETTPMRPGSAAMATPIKGTTGKGQDKTDEKDKNAATKDSK